MQDLNVTMIQTDIVWEDYQANIDRLEEKLQDLGQTDLIILPEMFASGFTMNPLAVAQSMDGPIVEWLMTQSSNNNADIVGSVVIKENSHFFNRLIWAKPNNEILFYDKHHLFGFAGEQEQYKAGSKKLIVTLKGWKIAAFICYDLRFPVWCRNTSPYYDMAVYIANWPEIRSLQWKTMIPARAIENQSYVIAVNRVGVDGNDIRYSGNSCMVNPLGEVEFEKAENENIFSTSLDYKKLNVIRLKFPFLRDADRFQLS